MKHAASSNLGYLIARSAHMWNQELLQAFREQSYTDQKPSYGAVFVPLFDNNPLSTEDIIRASGLTKQTISIYIKQLVDLGYISKTKSPTDKRSKVISLTPKGHKLKNVADNAVHSANNQFLRKLGKKDFDNLSALLTRCIGS